VLDGVSQALPGVGLDVDLESFLRQDALARQAHRRIVVYDKQSPTFGHGIAPDVYSPGHAVCRLSGENRTSPWADNKPPPKLLQHGCPSQ